MLTSTNKQGGFVPDSTVTRGTPPFKAKVVHTAVDQTHGFTVHLLIFSIASSSRDVISARGKDSFAPLSTVTLR